MADNIPAWPSHVVTRVAASREAHAKATGQIDPMDIEDIDRALGSLENPDLVDSMGPGFAIELIRQILADYRPKVS